MTEREPVLRLTDVRIQRAGTVIVEKVSWTIEHGQHWIMLGANGSGKTSLLSAMMGYLPNTSGEIEILGERYGEGDWREMRRRIGIVSSSLMPMLEGDERALQTVISGKSAMLGLWGQVAASDVAAAQGILAQIECAHLADRSWRVLSQGERQRILIGRAIMARPPLLILDEPCAGLDPAAREHFLQFLERWVQSGEAPTLVLVTHHVEEIIPLFSHVIVLRKGNVLASGSKQDVLTSDVLSAALGSPITLAKASGRYTLIVGPRVSD